MAQKKFIIDGGFQTNSDSILTGNLDMTGNINMTGNIIPTVDSDGVTGYDLGSPTAKWRDLYLSSGSLYIDGQKVVESNAGTIVMQADADQSLLVKTSGSGTLTLQSGTTINVASTLQMAAGVNITSADGVSVNFGDRLNMNGNRITNVGAPVDSNDLVTKTFLDTAIAGISNAITESDSNVTINDAGTGEVVFTVDGATRMEVSAAGVAVNNLTIGGVAAATTAYADTAEADAKAYADGIVATEASARAAADTALDTSLKAYADTAEADAKAYADGIVATEASARAAADTALQSNIDAEASARATADTALANDLTAKLGDATVDGSAGNTVTDRIATALASANTYADSVAATEHAHHEAGDATTLTSANAYTDAREVAITTAYTAYADQAEADAETAAATYTDSKVATEASARIAADNAIDGRLTTVEGAYVAKTSAQALHATDALRLNANVLSLHKGNGTSETVDLSLYLDDSNLARIISGTVDGNTGIATFSRDDTTTFTVDMSAFLDNTNLSRITSAAWNTGTGVLTLTRNDATTVTVDLDNRYLLTTDNAPSASKLLTARTIALSGDVSGSVAFDGSANVTISAVVADDSHNHVIANVDGLQAALDGKSATSHNHTLDSLSNTTITSNTAGEILKWNGTAWVNATLAEAGIQAAGNYQPAGSYVTTTSAQALHSTDALRVSGTTVSLYKGDGTFESITTQDTNTWRPVEDVLTSTSTTNSLSANQGRVLKAAVDTNTSTLAAATSSATANTIVKRDASGNFMGGLLGNANTASALQTGRTIALAGDVTGSAIFNGTANVTITATVANDSHSHSDYITSNASDTATGIYTFSNTTNSTSGTTGAIVVSGGIGVAGNVYVGGDVTAYSDRRLKDNIEVIADAGAKVAALNGVTFTRKEDGGASTGLIAQDVQAVLPEAVGEDADGMLAVKYGNMVGLLVEAIKELQAEVAALKAGK